MSERPPEPGPEQSHWSPPVGPYRPDHPVEKPIMTPEEGQQQGMSWAEYVRYLRTDGEDRPANVEWLEQQRRRNQYRGQQMAEAAPEVAATDTEFEFPEFADGVEFQTWSAKWLAEVPSRLGPNAAFTSSDVHRLQQETIGWSNTADSFGNRPFRPGGDQYEALEAATSAMDGRLQQGIAPSAAADIIDARIRMADISRQSAPAVREALASQPITVVADLLKRDVMVSDYAYTYLRLDTPKPKAWAPEHVGQMAATLLTPLSGRLGKQLQSNHLRQLEDEVNYLADFVDSLSDSPIAIRAAEDASMDWQHTADSFARAVAEDQDHITHGDPTHHLADTILSTLHKLYVPPGRRPLQPSPELSTFLREVYLGKIKDDGNDALPPGPNLWRLVNDLGLDASAIKAERD